MKDVEIKCTQDAFVSLIEQCLLNRFEKDNCRRNCILAGICNPQETAVKDFCKVVPSEGKSEGKNDG